jgi:hypothetical protein
VCVYVLHYEKQICVVEPLTVAIDGSNVPPTYTVSLASNPKTGNTVIEGAFSMFPVQWANPGTHTLTVTTADPSQACSVRIFASLPQHTFVGYSRPTDNGDSADVISPWPQYYDLASTSMCHTRCIRLLKCINTHPRCNANRDRHRQLPIMGDNRQSDNIFIRTIDSDT